MTALQLFMDRYVQLSTNDQNYISSFFEINTFRKKAIILHEGDICRYFYFFESGLIRYFYNIDGVDITKTFAIAPYCFTSKKSFRLQIPAAESIEALDTSKVWQLHYSDYKKLEQLESWHLFIQALTHEIQDFTDQLMLESKTITAEARYQHLLKQYPECILKKIPLKYMASFLGIAPQSLSRIRHKSTCVNICE